MSLCHNSAVMKYYEDRRGLSLYMIKFQLEGDQEDLQNIKERTERYHSRGNIYWLLAIK